MKIYKITGVKKQPKRFKNIEKVVLDRIGDITFPIELQAKRKDSLGVDTVQFPNGNFINTSLLDY